MEPENNNRKRRIYVRLTEKEFTTLECRCKKNKMPGENFYKKLIANAILYRQTDRLFGRKNVDAIGDTNLKSFTVAYTLSLFHFRTQNRLDLWKIYEEQLLPDALMEILKQMLHFVYDNLLKSAITLCCLNMLKRNLHGIN